MVDSLLLSFFINDILLHVNIRHLKCAYIFTFVSFAVLFTMSVLHIQIYLKYICSSNVHVRYEKNTTWISLPVKRILFRGGYIPLMQFPLSVMLTLGFKAPTLIFVQQRVTPWIKAHQMASLMLEFCCVKSNSFSGKRVCIENYLKNKSREFHSFWKSVHQTISIFVL